MTDSHQTSRLLTELPRYLGFAVFEQMPCELVQEVLCSHPVISLPEGTDLIRHNEPNDKLYLLLQGKVAILREDMATLRKEGPGAVLGEISLVDRQYASASVSTLSDCVLLVFDERRFWALTERSHAFSVNMLRLLVQRARLINRQYCDSLQQHEKTRAKAYTDSLTGLLNRTWMNEQLPALYTELMRAGRHCSIVMADLDHFKKINDCFGHHAGDQVLKQVAAIFRDFARGEDPVIRYGGDELIMILPDTRQTLAHRTAERIQSAVGKALFRHGNQGEQIQVTLSVGVASAHTPGIDLTGLFKQADSSLYSAKLQGRNQVSTARPHG